MSDIDEGIYAVGVRKKEYHFKSTNEADTTYAAAWFPGNKFRGLIQFVHDAGEHIGRYDQIMRRFADEGYVVFGHDHIGHGRNAKANASLGAFGGENNYLHMIDDVQKIYRLVLADCRDIPKDGLDSEGVPLLRCLIGMGVGAGIVKAYVIRHSDCNAVILCGDKGFHTVWNRELPKCSRMMRRVGERSSAAALWEKREKRYNDYIENPEKDSWRTTLKYELQKYAEDECCGFDYDLYSYRTLLQLEGLFRMREWVDSYPEFLPIYIMGGIKDPVSNYTRETDKLLQLMRHSDAKNVFYKYYKNSRHDLFFDVEAAQVSRDILRFLNTLREQWMRADMEKEKMIKSNKYEEEK